VLIPCPHCGPRDEDEFAYGGDATRPRPPDPERLSDAEWTEWLFFRANPRGPHLEYWVHRFGCRRWLRLRRDTLTHEILEVLPAAPERSG
jgi:heterotetrameric sarcosine oxidase delta subunit